MAHCLCATSTMADEPVLNLSISYAWSTVSSMDDDLSTNTEKSHRASGRYESSVEPFSCPAPHMLLPAVLVEILILIQIDGGSEKNEKISQRWLL